ncbi:MAG: LysR substrate-binding domain-containing protein [Myxococcaceae bacterium]
MGLWIRAVAVTTHRKWHQPAKSVATGASPSTHVDAGAPKRPEDLASHRLIAFERRPALQSLALFPTGGGEPVSVAVRPSVSSNDYVTITHAARSGLGITELPAILYEQRAGLVRVLPEWTLGEATLHLLYAADRLLPRTTRVVLDAILTTVPEQLRAACADLAPKRVRRAPTSPH